MLHARILRFGPFVLDVRTGELRKHGTRIRLQDQLSLVTILFSFEINHIGKPPTIRSAITLTPCSTLFGSGSGLCFPSFVTAAA